MVTTAYICVLSAFAFLVSFRTFLWQIHDDKVYLF